MPASRISLENLIYQSDSVLRRKDDQASILWLETERPYIKLVSPEKESIVLTIVLRYDAGIIVGDTGFKPQNAATVFIYRTMNTKTEGF